jgi:hypothetical protein
LAKTKFFIATNGQLKKAIALIVNGFSKEVLNKLPGICCGSSELLNSLEGSVG